MSLISSMSLFFLSFAPLWLSVLFIDIKSIIENQTPLYTEWISIVTIIIFTVVALLALRKALSVQKRAGIQKYRIVAVEEEKTITAEYLLSYILPLFAFDFTQWSQVILFLIYFLTLAFLCIRHNHFSVNIVLEFMKFRFYQCELENEDGITITKCVISQEKLNNHVTHILSARPLNNEYLLDLLDWTE